MTMNSPAEIYPCPGCGHKTDRRDFQIAGALEAYACPSCGLTVDEGQKILQEDLAAMFKKGMDLSASQSGQRDSESRFVPSSALGYSVSQHYHHSSHVTTPTTAQATEERFQLGPPPSDRDTEMQAQAQAGGYGATVEPYMDSGYEYLANRDYLQQAHERQPSENQQQSSGGDHPPTHVLDPSFSSKEWWRDFVDHQPVEYQYGMFEQVTNQGQSKIINATEDEEMS